jgi:hypothetical protein
MAVHVAEERLLAGVAHLDGLAGVQGEQAGVHVHGQVLAAAERPADAGQGEPDLVGRQPERGADLLLVHVQPLGRDEQVDAAGAVRHRKSRLGPEKGLVLHPDPVGPAHDDVGLGRRVALADPQVPDQVAAGVDARRAWLQCRDGVGDRLEDLVVDGALARGQPGDLGMVGGDQRDRLAHVPDQVGGEHGLVGVFEAAGVQAGDVVADQDGVDTRGGQGTADRDRSDPGVRVRAAQRDAPDHVVRPRSLP